MRIAELIALLCLLFTAVAPAQQWNIGFTAGTRLTNDFLTVRNSNPADQFGNPANFFRWRSGDRSPILGMSFETWISRQFSFEASVLHREFHSEITFREFPLGLPATENITQFKAGRTWVFPLLLKYHLPTGSTWRPFLSAGPSFRTQEDVAGIQPSQAGLSVGAGVTYKWKRLNISPSLRYTRWKKENVFPRYATKPDQLEFLTTFGIESNSKLHRIAGGKIQFGAIVGMPLLKGFSTYPFFERPEERWRYSAGLLLETRLPRMLALEVNGIYRPIRAKGANPDRPTAYSVLTWQIPVLLKKYWTLASYRPFLAAGPSFRLSGNLNGYDPSKFGGTIGLGLEKLFGPARISPAIRYTRWLNDKPRSSQLTNPHSLEVLVGISF